MKRFAAISGCRFAAGAYRAAPCRRHAVRRYGRPARHRQDRGCVGGQLSGRRRIKAIFDESNIDRLRAEFKVQFCQVAGGGCDYKGHYMTAAHKGLHLTNADFNAVVEDLQAAMDKVRRALRHAEPLPGAPGADAASGGDAMKRLVSALPACSGAGLCRRRGAHHHPEGPRLSSRRDHHQSRRKPDLHQQ